MEIAARYSGVRGTGDATSLGEGNEVTAGVDVYAAQRSLKVQADYTRAWDDDPSAGWNQVRAQLQLAY